MVMTDHSSPRKISKAGNSLRTNLDPDLLDTLGWDQGDLVVQSIDDGRLVLERAEIRRVSADNGGADA